MKYILKEKSLHRERKPSYAMKEGLFTRWKTYTAEKSLDDKKNALSIRYVVTIRFFIFSEKCLPKG